ncbi:uncharacterized protein LOC106158612 isoform X4 [Lingula anatina]|uniref:Uncharacterized protein LOC106158612 isoform X3 n=1 Tax=Lingula anatina TaxID=7574 RepID=A0A1S3HVR3_LINAN|nr:uncharacterized protein LOC106158612 isoform X3 [Lingula anatina]XP_013390126.1 uncharacterized protein LOC106158612 isoform X4 [Lingula anatina]|eukprot:XP_013390125.1 uncharacterized protein LOC106158612 isoform X3 [Lingula anatina]
MAAADLLRVRLPYPWSYGVTEDGRVFFINDDTKTTTWLHPMTKEPVQTGLTASSDLPRGWEHAFNSDGVLYFIDHNTQVSTFTHPVTGEVMAEEGAPQQKIESPKEKSSIEPKRGSLIKKGSKKIVDSPMAKRSEEAPVSMKGWLYKQEGGTIKQWKRRWFVLSDFCLFYYKGPEEQQTLGSILLPSYKINPCARDDGIGKKFAFKAEHQNMRTYYFAAETKEGMQKWMNAMSLATILQRDPTYQRRWQQTSQYPPHDYHSNASVERQFNPPQPSPNVSNASEDAGFGPPPHRHHLAAPNVHEAPPGRNSDGSDAMRDQSYSGGRLFDHYNPSSNGHIPQNYDPRSVPNGYGRPLPDSGMQRGSYTSESSHGDYRQRAPPYGGPGSAGPPHLPGNQPHSGDRGYPATRSSTTLPQAGPERGRSPQRLGTNNRSISLDRRQFQQDMPPSGGPPGPPTHSAPLPQHPQQQAPSQFRNREEPVRSGYVQRRPDSGDFMRQPQNMPYEQKQPGSAQPARPVSAYYEYERPQRTDQQFRDTQGGRGHGGSSEMLGPLQVHVSQESQKDAAQNSMGYSGPGRSKGDQGRPLSQYDYNRPAQGQGRSNNDESSRRELQKQESLRQLRDWHNRMQRSSLSRPDQSPNPDHSSHQPQQTQAQHLKQPVYENIPGQTARRNLSSSFQEDSPAPVRPPYPAAYRDKLVEDAAAKKTPTTAQNMLESSQNSMRHVNEPHFFQYPQVQQTRPAQPQEPSVPDSYLWAKQHVEQEEQRQKEQPKPREEMPRYPDSYLKAKDEVERMQPRPREKEHAGHQDDRRAHYGGYPTVAQGHHQPAKADYEHLDNFYSNPNDPPEGRHGERGDTRTPHQERVASTVTMSKDNSKVPHRSLVDENLSDSAIPDFSFRDILEGSVHSGKTPTIANTDESIRILNELIESYGHERKEIRGGTSEEDLLSQDREHSELKQQIPSDHLIPSGEQILANRSKVEIVTITPQGKGSRPMPKTKSPPMMAVQPLSSFKPKTVNKPLTSGPVKPNSPSSKSPSHSNVSEDLRSPNQNTHLNGVLGVHQSSSPPQVNTSLSTMDATHMQPSAAPGSSKANIAPPMGSSRVSPSTGAHHVSFMADSSAGEMTAHSTTLAREGGRYPSEGAAPQRGRDKLKSLDISTVKEEPDMSDQDVIATKNFKNLRKNFALNGKIRLSISASDLLGKSHEELVLLLIELRRKQSRLEAARDVYKQQLETAKVREKDFQALLQTGNRPPDYMERDHHMYLDIKKQLEDIEKQLEVHKPLVNLVDNLVKMGSLYGGDNDMFASQYKRNLLSPEEYTPPKRMLDFTRKMQEEKLAQDYEKEVKHLSEDEVDLEEKLQKLYGLDRSLQEKSFMVTSLQEDKELLEKALNNVKAQLEHSQDDLREAARLSQQQKNIEKELSKVRQQLADNSKVLEELTTENAKVEHEVKILRSKIHGVRKSTSTPTLSNNESVRAKVKLEQELSKVQDMMSGLNEQGKKLRETMQNLRNSSTDVRGSDKPQDKSSTYNETDLDSNNTKNIALSGYDRRNGRSYLDQDDDDSVQDSDTPWDISEADENTKRFFGLLPKDKPRARTLREVKQRETERRSRDRERRKPSDTQEAPEQGIRERSNSMPERGRRSQSLPRKLNEVPSLQQHAKNSVVSPKELFTGKRIKDRERRLSAAERLFPTPTNNSTPTTSAPSNSNTSTSHMPRPAATASVRPMQLSAESKARRHSELGLAPKPFQASGSTGGFSRVNPSLGPNRTGSTPNLYNTTQGTGPVKQGPAVPPKKKKGPPRRTGARYLTISSSAPLQLETSPTKKLGVQTSAGDLIINQNDPFESATGVRRGSLDFTPDYVQSTSFKNEHISIDTIEKEVLFIPGKIEIPERYVPESDEEELTEDEKRMRQKKADRIKKLLSAQSLQDWTETELDPFKQENVHDKFSEEKHHREHLLSLNQALAKEVTQKTRQVAAQRRKTWSSSDTHVVTATRVEVSDGSDSDIENLGTPLVQQRENFFT